MKRLLLTMSFFCALNCHAISKKEVYRLLVKHEVKHPRIVLKQSILETGHFKSYASRKRNNLFGIVGGRKHFKSHEDCIRYYKRWQKNRYKKGNYYTFLKQIKYAKDKQYISKLKRIKT